jgi:hypothetical protein
MPSDQHNNLVWLGAKFLREEQRCRVVLEEPCKRLGERDAIGQRPDVFGWRHSRDSHLIEVKVSRADWLADAIKAHHASPSLGRKRWLLTTEGLVESFELPEWQGHLEEVGGRIVVRREADVCNGISFADELAVALTVIQAFQNQTGRTANEVRPCNDHQPSLKLREIVTRHHAESPEDSVKLIRRLHPELINLAGNKVRAYRQIEQVLAELAPVQEVV